MNITTVKELEEMSFEQFQSILNNIQSKFNVSREEAYDLLVVTSKVMRAQELVGKKAIRF